jgi:4-amino-4-deoxy-L-arabinose transferase-like glycosyltransferase
VTAIDTPRADLGRGAGWLASRVGLLVRGRADEPAWVRPSLVGVGLLAGVLYLWQLTVSGYAYTFYAMAAQAGSQSWSAWFFGSIDAANFITVDKPPAPLWVTGLAVRLFGLSSWSILLPQALMGVATVLLLFAVVRRSFGPVAGLVAALVMATTPVAVLIFRYNNPDALLTLLLVAAAGTLLRAVENGRTRWLVATGVLVGFGFLTKYLQAYQVLPALGLTYLVAGPGRYSRRIGQLAVATGVVAVASGWWVAVMELLPAASRPYVGGSTGNSVLDLIFGYDGLGRIFGASGPGGQAGGPGGGGGPGFGGAAGFLRLFNEEWGGQIAWLLPFAITSLAGGLWVRRRAPRTDPRRTGYLLWGGWLVVNGAVFSLMSGIAHPYYAVVLAPAIGALVGAGVVDLWRWRARSLAGGVLLGGAIAATGWLALLLLDRTPEFAPGLGIIAAFAATAAGILVAIPGAASGGRRVAMVGLVVGAVALAGGPLAYNLATMATAHSGGTVAAGPGGGAGVAGGGPGGGFPGGGGAGVAGGGAGVAGGGDTAVADDALLAYLVENRGTASWLVAVSGSGSAASIQLATGQPVLTMGGFNGSDAAPTGEQIAAIVRAGRLRYVLAGGDRGGFGGGQAPGGSGGASALSWVSASCAVVDPGSTGRATLYDCAAAGG